jgi:hypothetical protein
MESSFVDKSWAWYGTKSKIEHARSRRTPYEDAINQASDETSETIKIFPFCGFVEGSRIDENDERGHLVTCRRGRRVVVRSWLGLMVVSRERGKRRTDQ